MNNQLRGLDKMYCNTQKICKISESHIGIARRASISVDFFISNNREILHRGR